MRLNYWLPVVGLLTLSLDAQTSAGNVRFIRQATSSLDPYTSSTTTTQQQWFQTHFYRMTVYSPYFDDKLSWYPNGDFYKDLYAIYVNDALATQHPEWILKDANGNKLYIPWGCSGGTCPQYAADVSSAAFRQWWINEANTHASLGYHGIFVDDVNMEFRVGDGNGNFVNPIDPNTGALMTYDNWRRYVAEFCEAIRSAFPSLEIIHNSLWYADSWNDGDTYVQRQIAAGTYQNIEFGVNDGGLTGGTGSWSLNSLLTHIDHVHATGRSVIIAGVPVNATGEEYALANSFAVSDGADMIGSVDITPDNWWTGYDTVLGSPSGARAIWNNLIRRDFSGGMVLVNPPQSGTVSVTLPKSYRRIDGTTVSSVTLSASQGAVLIDPNPTQPDTTAPSVSITWPTAGASVSGTVSVTAAATDNVGVTKVELYVDGALIATDTASPYGAAWNTSGVAGGNHTAMAKAYDAAGNVGTSATVTFSVTQPDTTAPAVSITAPAAGSTVSGTVTVTASASDNVGVTKVEIYIDSALKVTDTAAPYAYSWNTSGAAAGNHSIVAKAYDAAGNVGTSASDTVTIGSAGGTTTGACPPAALNAFTACYYSGEAFNTLVLTRTETSISYDWGAGSPSPAVPVDGFSASWEGKFSFRTGNYTFTVTADDGVRLYLDGALVLDKWILQPATTYQIKKAMSSGTHTIKLVYFEHPGMAVAKLNWAYYGWCYTPASQ